MTTDRRGFFGRAVAAVAALFGYKAAPVATPRQDCGVPYWIAHDRRRWQNYTMAYTEMSREELQARMRAAFRKLELQPPLPGWERACDEVIAVAEARAGFVKDGGGI